MPTFVHGSGAKVYVGGYDLSPYFKNYKVPNAYEKADATTYGAQHHQTQPGMNEPGPLTLDGFWDQNTGASHERLKAILGVTGTILTVSQVADTPGNLCELGNGYGAKYEIGQGMTGLVAASAEVELGTSWDDLGYWLHEKKAESVANAGYTTVDRGVANTSSTGYSIHLHGFAFTGSAATLTVIVEHSTNGSSWATLDTFTAVSSSGFVPMSQELTGTTSVNRFIRVRWTITGSPNFTFAVGIGLRGKDLAGL